MKDVLIIGIACIAAILLGAWLYFSGGSLYQSSLKTPHSFVVLDQGTFSGGITERKNFRIKTQDDLNELWLMVHGTGAPTTVDFSKNEVLAIFDGTHTTGGYAVEVSNVVDLPQGNRTVSITRTEPGKTCRTSDAISSPFQIIVLPVSNAPIVREEKLVVTDCD